jgi:peptide/nickel transport system ATP-binding protein
VPGKTVLNIDGLKKYYSVAANKMFGGGDTRTVKANEEITFHARESETVAIVGESGCGKSTLAKVLLGLETATEGSVTLDGKEIGNTEVGDRSKGDVASVQMVFQNPFDTLNPSHSVGSQIIRTLEKFGIGDTVEDRKNRMLELLDLVKLPRAFADRMPRQLSGGQKQRIGVARAFAGQPKVVVADEPVSALDVSVQAAVTELLMEIQREAKTTMLFISHDLSVVRYIADRVVVMYLGHIVEQGSTDDIFSPPYHPYTEALLSAIPIADTSVQKKHIVLDGDIPSALNPPSGCPFQTRCPRKSQVEGNLCETDLPPMRTIGEGHQVKCHLSEKILQSMEPVIVLGDKKKGTKKPATKKPAAKKLAAATAASGVAALPALNKEEQATPSSAARARKSAKKVSSPAKKASAKPKSKKDAAPARMRKPAKPDDLKMISGVGPKIEGILNGLGVYKFEQISKWKKAERDWVDNHLKFKGRIDRDDWVKQAKALAKAKP